MTVVSALVLRLHRDGFQLLVAVVLAGVAATAAAVAVVWVGGHRVVGGSGVLGWMGREVA